MNNDIKQFIEKNIRTLEDEGIVMFLYVASVQLSGQGVNTLCEYLDSAKIEYKEYIPAIIEELVKDNFALTFRQKVTLTSVIDQLPKFNYTDYTAFRNIVASAIRKVYPDKVVLPDRYGIEYVMERV